MDPGTQLGPYEIKEPLGEGGMGHVYRAHDATLRRDVALKLLPEDVADDPQRLARLKREARSLAALNHPHIAAVHGFEERDGTSFIVMELVEGRTLAEKLGDGPLPVREALELGVQIARALEAAHERGIVHRDLKPQNVKITPTGEAKVLDFGLAKPIPRADSDTELPTATVKTRTGAVMGTPPYMSPEQIRGEAVDQRTDIWAFGCLLYEMLTGQGPFTAETAGDTMSAILSQDPDWDGLPAGTPVLARSLLRRCLSKDPDYRLQHIGDGRIELEEALRDDRDDREISPEATTPHTDTLRRAMWAATAAAIVLVVVMLGWLSIRPERAPPETRRFQLQPPPGVIVDVPGGAAKLAISDDGRWVVFDGTSDDGDRLYSRSTEDLEARAVQGTEGASTPFFSPDGRWLGFWAGGMLQKVPFDGEGAAVPICPARRVRGASWGEDGTILFSARGHRGGLVRVSSDGGEPEVVTTPDPEQGEFTHYWPHHLPGGRAALFTIQTGGLGSDDSEIAVLSLHSGEYRTLGLEGVYPRYLAGYLIYLRTGTLYAVPFDLDELEVTGESRPVLDDVYYYIGSFFAAYAVSESGSLVYVPGAPRPRQGQLVWLDREGNVGSLIDGTRAFDNDFAPFSLSPDQGRLAIAIRPELEEAAIWTYEFERDNWSFVTPATLSGGVLWSPNGEWLVFNPPEPGHPKIARIRADGTGGPELLTTGREWDYAGSFSPDGRELAFMRQSGSGQWELWILPLDGNRPARPFLATSAPGAWPVFSPDGRWIAYDSWVSGQREIYVRPYPGPGARIKVSTQGGVGPPRWSPDGTELFYRSGKEIWAAPVTIGKEFEAGRPTRLLEADFLIHPWYNQFTVSPDGQRFYMVRYGEETRREPRLAYVSNWVQELESRVPSPE